MLISITNEPRDYAWGSRTGIAELQGRGPSALPEAELWLGTHPGSPARAESGEPLAETAGELPFLLKLLAASAPLSLQAHPTLLQAQEGFAREEAAGIPRDAAERNYRDPHPKPEMIYALSDPFRALCGFRPVAETRALLEPLADDPRIAALLARLRDDGDLEEVFSWLIAGGDDVDEIVTAAVEASAVADDLSWDVVRRLAETSPGDPGIVISLLLHAVDLRPGEALFLPAGNIHAYVEGTGVELMAPSDNVLRGGLTTKHVDVPELLRVLDFAPHPLPRLGSVPVAEGVDAFRPEGVGFELLVVSGEADADLPGPAIAVALYADAVLDVAGSRLPLERGRAAFTDAPRVHVAGGGRVVIATGRTRP